MKLQRYILLIALVVWPLLSCSLIERELRPLNEREAVELADELNAIRQRHNISSMAVGGVTAGEELFLMEAGSAPNEFHLASVTKIITAVAVIKLVSERKLELDELVATRLPQGTQRVFDGTTVLHLLSHTSGLRDCGGGEVCAVVPPGISYHYENANYEILASVIEDVSGESYQDYIAGEVFEPLGIAEGVWHCTDNLPRGAGGICMTPSALAGLLRALLARDLRLMNAYGYELLFSRTMPGLSPPRHILWNACYEGKDAERFWHAGIDETSGAEAVLFPEENAAYFILSNSRYSNQVFDEVKAVLEHRMGLPSCSGGFEKVLTEELLRGNYVAEAGSRIEFPAAGASEVWIDGERQLIRPTNGHMFVVFDEGLDEALAVPLAGAAGDVLEVVYFDGEVRGVVWEKAYYRKAE